MYYSLVISRHTITIIDVRASERIRIREECSLRKSASPEQLEAIR
jgi:hypothetical protein